MSGLDWQEAQCADDTSDGYGDDWMSDDDMVRRCPACGEVCDSDEGCYCPDECPIPWGADNTRGAR